MTPAGKKILVAVGLVVIAIVVVLGAAIGSAFMGRQSIVDGAEVNGVRIVKDGFVSMAVIPFGDQQVAMVDAGNDSAGHAILAELERRKLGPDAVAAIFLTHGHPDHIAAARLFPRAKIFALDREVPLVEGHEGAHGPMTRMMPVKPTGLNVTAVHDGQTIRLGDNDLRVFAVPGHTQGSAAYVVSGVLLMGDAADFNSSGQMIGSPWVFSDSQQLDRQSLGNLAARLAVEHVEVKAIACAHSGVSTAGLAPLAAFARANR